MHLSIYSFFPLLVPSERGKLFCYFSTQTVTASSKTCSFDGKQSVIRSDDEERIVSNYLNGRMLQVYAKLLLS